MPRAFFRHPVNPDFQQKLTQWAALSDSGFCFKGTGWGQHFNHTVDAFAGCGVFTKAPESLSKTEEFIEKANDYILIALGYDIKNQLENLASENPDKIGFQDHLVFIPNITIKVNNGEAEIGCRKEMLAGFNSSDLIAEINKLDLETPNFRGSASEPTAVISKSEYLKKIADFKMHLQRGDIYQANLCQEFYWSDAETNAASLFECGFTQNPNPFAAYLKHEQRHCLSWSPERFLSKNGDTLLAQPMKGTAPRNNDSKIDRANKTELINSEKDRRENVMIVDMVRNDLSKHAKPGSVKVPELYQVDTYPKVHQMHSTVTAQMKQETSIFSVILGAFPMASMTGAPKISAMEIIEKLESTKRGLYSGAIGFITPDKNFDLNVIIRTLLFNEKDHYLSCQVGGGITDLSDAMAEYEECLVKLKPITELIKSIQR